MFALTVRVKAFAIFAAVLDSTTALANDQLAVVKIETLDGTKTVEVEDCYIPARSKSDILLAGKESRLRSANYQGGLAPNDFLIFKSEHIIVRIPFRLVKKVSQNAAKKHVLETTNGK